MPQVINIRPNALGAHTFWTGTTGGSVAVADIDPGDPPSADGLTTYMFVNASTTGAQSFTCLGSDIPADIASVSSVSILGYYGNHTELDNGLIANVFCRDAGGTDGAASGFAGFAGSVPDNFRELQVARPGGGPWLATDIVSTLEFGISIGNWNLSSATEASCTSLWLKVVYERAPSDIGTGRDASSRRLWFIRDAIRPFRITLPVSVGADLELLDMRGVAHTAGPNPSSTEGWGIANWENRLGQVLSRTIDPNKNTVELVMRDRRKISCLYRDVGWSKISSDAQAEGVPRFSAGVTRTFTRASLAWIENPHGIVVKVDHDNEKLQKNGLLLEEARTNHIPQSSFKNQLTGWTTAGDGTTTADSAATEQLFDPDETGFSMKMTAGNPISTEYVVTGTASASIANLLRTLSIDYDDEGEGIYYRVIHSSGPSWWDKGTQAWKATAQENLLTSSTAKVRGVDVLQSNGVGTYTIEFVIKTSQPVGTVAHIHHVQVEDGEYETSRVITEAASVARAADQLLVSNNTAARSFNNAQGTFACEVIPEWDQSTITADKTVFYVSYDANNYEWLYYESAGNQWVFERKVATTIYQATASANPVQGTTYKLVARWTGSNSEEDLTAFTASVFVDGVKGTDVVTGAAPTESATNNLEMGSKAGSTSFSGNIRLIHSYPYVASDVECKRLPPQ